MAGVAARRRGDPADARRWWQEALAAGERIPNVMGERIARRLAELGVEPARAVRGARLLRGRLSRPGRRWPASCDVDDGPLTTGAEGLP